MGDSYIGEIRMFGGNFAPANWAFCQGQLLNIQEYDALFNLIGTTYGGDGQNTFALPNLQSRLAVHQGNGNGLSNYAMGSTGGAEQVTVTTAQMPIHGHPMAANNNANSGTSASGVNAIFGATDPNASTPYGSGTSLTTMSPKGILPYGGNQPHSNIKPYQCVNFIISLQGIYPSQN